MATEYGKRLRQARIDAGLTQEAAALKTGIGQSTISTAERMGAGSAETPVYAEAYGVNALWLAKGTGEKKATHAALTLQTPSRKKDRPDELVIPQFNTGGAMGDGLLLRDQPGVIQSWSVSAEWVQKNIKSHTGAANLCIVTGFGDSMKGMFNSGDPLVIDRGINTVDYDAVYFFRVGEEGFIKRLQRIPGEGLRVLSENKQYEAWNIKSDMDFEVFGRVVKAWQGEDF